MGLHSAGNASVTAAKLESSGSSRGGGGRGGGQGDGDVALATDDRLPVTASAGPGGLPHGNSWRNLKVGKPTNKSTKRGYVSFCMGSVCLAVLFYCLFCHDVVWCGVVWWVFLVVNMAYGRRTTLLLVGVLVRWI